MASLTDSLSLDGSGAMFGGGEVVARIVPPDGISDAERKAIEYRMPLLIGHRLERAIDGKWGLLLGNPRTPPRWDISVGYGLEERPGSIEYYVYPSPRGTIPLPQGALRVQPPPRMRINLAFGGAAQWAYPLARPLPIRLGLGPYEFESIDEASIRWRQLREPDPASREALNWSLRVAPHAMPTNELVKTLVEDLRTFRYTLDNPSGGARDPLGDFLSRTRAGHCEYFAHALASALRHRGVASRVVNGYRLGEWIAEGGYWLVTQDDAHSWVEYVDPGLRLWLSADPTPLDTAPYSGRWPLAEKMGRMMDVLKFRWDRYVVRFSDAQQQKGAEWMIKTGSKLFAAGPRPAGARPSQTSLMPLFYLACAGALCALLFLAWKKRGRIKRLFPPRAPRGAIRVLRPLLKAARLPPMQGETLRAWLSRLAEARPDRREPLAHLAGLIEASAYGRSGEDVSKPVKTEAAALGRALRVHYRPASRRARPTARAQP
jgi:transglutaminase-like putative cysteine protease